MNIEKEFQNTEELVRSVLEDYKKARNSDEFLVWVVWRKLQGLDLNKFAEGGFADARNAETIRRNRAKIQNDDGDLLPTDPEVIKNRKIKEEKVQQYFGQGEKLSAVRET